MTQSNCRHTFDQCAVTLIIEYQSGACALSAAQLFLKIMTQSNCLHTFRSSHHFEVPARKD